MTFVLWHVLAVVLNEQPFSSIRKAEASFGALERGFSRYRKHLGDCAPDYDASRSPGPPFDMYYHLEVLHRMLANMTDWIEDARGMWYDLRGNASEGDRINESG